MPTGSWLPIRLAWQRALYGPAGFYRREWPADHFRTSPHTSASFGAAVAALVRRHCLTSMWDIGAGDGELLRQVHSADLEIPLVGVELRARPAALPGRIGWRPEPPVDSDGLVFANELLDNVPCDVVELDGAGECRIVEVDIASGRERCGAPATPAQVRWLDAWWQLSEPGQRAEVGLAREAMWAGIQAANPRAVCVAVDYGHLAADRPPGGSLASYRTGTQRPASFDGDHDVTAHVAVDALAAAVGGQLRRQRDVLHELGLSGRRPPLSRASADPAGYLRDLSHATGNAELTAIGGLGDFYWLLSGAQLVRCS